MIDKSRVQPVILCGGSGTRLWPLSRTGFPKQFLCLTGAESLFQQATKRLIGLGGDNIHVADLLVVTGDAHRFLALEQLREIGVEPGAVLLEPVARNTAPALTLAALAAVENGADPVLVVTPADQAVADTGAFNGTMHDAIHQAADGSIVILGVTPSHPETGYGYIQAVVAPAPILVVERFVEKPDEATAMQYLSEGGYYWNAGMFVLKASVWLQAVESFRPDIAATARAAWAQRSSDSAFIRPGTAEFAAVPSDSIDYAVMEHCPGSRFPIRMAQLDAGWSDLGAWDAVWNVLPKDSDGNVYVGDVLAVDCHNTLVHGTSRLVAMVGVQGLVVVETPDAVLVADQSRGQDVKHIVNALQQQKREEHTLHRKVHRPWGWYDSVDEGGRFKVKRIQVKPGASLSLQKHHHRAEHWVVVKGTAAVTCGDKKQLLTENQSTYIPLGEVHRLANPGKIPLEIIEVQSGSYLGEDDIVRFEDHYGRNHL
ncbi:MULTISPECIES: mannose-1-phosphate guanylyltransferase/mannose-6-phosphate isomerase [unclassified Haematospirillum]|uniref:mannose-1-phosphate guanylyltransferase/mannose-6-phosphate isomerase n=1 Tax=unclassified Haematospirillum TaxID=2622088 RepID=UPI00143917CF|nr:MULTISPECIES: mannose-1-phosphate guanylyltransferase/mannose-6-phosphate isomerase [unclassified Haematospirillum]NKD56023.1 mannose-1-phosphate guanylyltransferase/mannose-6-phosphate isomerase [Haematospirillum sp. H4890]NKD76026.1 mannose-1-phosphate guanylyltransferase/mannose-6-phosphate isomerase [Haematospirillum sp. H4485]NKD88696.1 mannose-1-phosphate guanylyltransferase/mannose-6-phosphate isomerase [Haematospirillum sp. 15-248]